LTVLRDLFVQDGSELLAGQHFSTQSVELYG
jgi:hypothetical protein